ncbi:carboxylic acid reductase [Mycobacterium sp. 48b]|uniref:carboxylic acid reductase n=1 Tax=Mycobacterium sp. 48b TaxID=3400426 RepID=UPI003AAC971F
MTTGSASVQETGKGVPSPQPYRFESDEQLLAAQPDRIISERLAAPSMRLRQAVTTVLDGYADRPAVAYRSYELSADDRRTVRRPLPQFESITYRELGRRVAAVARVWHRGVNDSSVAPGDFVGILGFVSVDYTVVDLACLQMGAVVVPLPNVGQEVIADILGEVAPKVLCTSVDNLDLAVDAVLCSESRPGRVVVLDYVTADDDHRHALDAARARLETHSRAISLQPLSELISEGETLPPVNFDAHDDNYEDDADPLVCLLYTSGSTGAPKGAMYTEHMLIAPWQQALPGPVISFNYLPMSHMYGRAYLYTTLANGGTAYFAAKPDLSTFFEDLAMVRPTSLNLIPRVCEMIIHRYHGQLSRCSDENSKRADVEQTVAEDIRRNVLGGRYMWANCSTAPLSAQHTQILRQLLDVPLLISYGSTETGGIVMDGKVLRPPVLDYKLIDVPELGYYGSDKPFPRGELLVKSQHMMAGYFQRPEITAGMFDGDGFYRTGDIMAETGEDQLVYVDRRNNVLKLSQGEFVTVSHLEAVYASSSLIRQIYVYGSSEQSYVLAVIVPDPQEVSGDPSAVRGALSTELQQVARDAGLQPYEVPRDFIVEIEPFTVENGLITTVGKLVRPALRARYESVLQDVYHQIAEAQERDLAELRAGAGQRPILETVYLAVGATLGLPATAITPEARFSDLGGDSLAALSLATLLEESLHVDVPVGTVISPTASLQALAKEIERQQHSNTPTFAAVHGSGSAEIRATDLKLEKFIDTDTLDASRLLSPPTDTPRTVLITGANGYLGRFLCLEWLQRVAPVGGKVICIVRGNSTDQAIARMTKPFNSDPELLSRFTKLAQDHLEVVVGDISEPKLGVGEKIWERLIREVDCIVHSGALVNHVLPYRQLFGPNVTGTSELIRLAITARLKSLAFVSSVAAAFAADGNPIPEDADIRVAISARTVGDGYANGYAASKWAGEVLAREAHDLCGIPVAVFRSDMILAHSQYRGQLNVPDLFTRLIFSLIVTGIAPRSFYQSNGEIPRAHYDGLPVDFVAQAIVELGARATSGFQTYHVVNPHDDNVSMDTFVDWLAAVGYPVQRIDDHGDWFERFQSALRSLPENQRQHSVLHLLDAFRYAGPPTAGSRTDATRFRAGVAAVSSIAGGEIPHLSEKFIVKYATDLTALGLLTPRFVNGDHQ